MCHGAPRQPWQHHWQAHVVSIPLSLPCPPPKAPPFFRLPLIRGTHATPATASPSSGCSFAPFLIYFALSGAWQTLSWNEADKKDAPQNVYSQLSAPDHARWNPEDRAVPHVQVVCRAHEFWLRRHGGPRRVYDLAYGGAAKMGHRLPGGRCGTAHGFHVEYATPRRPLSEGPC